MKLICYTITIAIVFAIAGVVQAQGILKGTITDASNGETLIGANILLESGDGSFSRGTIANLEGVFEFNNVPAGTYTARVSYVGFTDQRITDITITDNETVTLNVELSPGVSLNPVVVSASKIKEKVTEAPSSIQVITSADIKNIASVTPADFIKSAAAVDVAQQGIASSTVVTRGFSNIFSGSLLMMTDNRIATVPSLRANLMHFIPLINDDIESIEVVLGPGAALYGPNANSGVVNILSKSPLVSTGTSIGVFGGNQNFFKGQFRTAHNFNNKLGIKVSGQYLQAEEFLIASDDPYFSQEQAARQAYLNGGGDPNSDLGKRIGIRNKDVDKYGFDARLDFNPVQDLSIILNAGLNNANNIELTGLGTAQAVDWLYSYYQGRVTYKRLFAQAFVNSSNSGGSYVVPTGQAVFDQSTQFVSQIQHSTVFNRFNFVYGGDYIKTNPVTGGTINGRNEDSDGFYEYGGYLQTKFSPASNLDLLVSFRADKHSRLEETQISPRAAIVYRPIPNQNFRFTYNRSFQTPSSNALFLDLQAGRVPIGSFYNLDVRAQGVPSTGFTFSRGDGGRPLFVSNFAPTAPAFNLNTQNAATWSLIRGIVGSALAANPATAGLAPAMAVAPLPGSANPAGGAYSAIAMALAKLNTATGSFDPVADVLDIDPMRPTIYNTFEVGYKGIINDRLLLSVDVYRTRAEDFVGPLVVETPNVFMSGANMAAYLTQYFTNVLVSQGMPPAQAQATAQSIGAGVGGQLGGLPLGVVTPDQAFNRDAVILTYRNFGDITYYGIDLGFDYLVSDRVRVMGNYSHMSRDKWLALEDNPDLNVFLNAPQNKFTVGMNYDRRDLGYDMGVKLRYIEGFPIQSGIYTTQNTSGDFDNIDSYYTVDLNMGYDIPKVKGVRATVTVNNLTNNKKPQFVGTPEIGIFAVGGVTVSF